MEMTGDESICLKLKPLADPRGGTRDARTPRSKFFHFHAVFGKKIARLPTLGVGPPLRKILHLPLVIMSRG